MLRIFRHIILCIATMLVALPQAVAAQEVERPADDFVIASLLIASPGDALYSHVGHAAIRMQCPDHQLDYVFTYETEDMSNRVLKFLAGNLKMGLFAVPTQEYLDLYAEEGRGVNEYVLSLPIEAKQNLWRVLDNHMMQGSDLPYDYLHRGCAYSTLMFLREGISPYSIEYGPWPEKYNLTRREITGLQMSKYPWIWAFLNLICNGEIDHPCAKVDKVIMPLDLLDVLSNATIDEHLILNGEQFELLHQTKELREVLISPFIVSLLLLILTVAALIFNKHFMDYVLLVIQTFLGAVTMYLVLFSSLCCTEWSWLIVPFNILPLVFWKWRKYWFLPFAAVLVIWELLMLFSPHQLTDTTYLILTLSLIADYIWNYLIIIKNKI